MTDTIRQVADNLEAAGVEARIWETGKGRLLISTHGARVLRCEVVGVEGSLIWHPQALLDREKTAQFVKQRKAMIGGDRLWIAPENGYHFTDLKKARTAPFEHYDVPGDVDPGNYKVKNQGDNHVTFSTDAKLADYRNGKTIRLAIDRSFRADYQFDAADADAGSLIYSVENTIEANGGDDGAVAGAWGILQVPTGGVLICPTTQQVNGARSYYDNYDAHHVIETAGAVRFKLDGKKRMKIGLSPAQTTGRMGYYRKVGDVHTLIYRHFPVIPGDEAAPYIDLPRSTDDIFGGDALQSYNDNGGSASFGEMEYHDPAVVVGGLSQSQTGLAQTMIFTGSEDAIRGACDKWLGVPLKG